VFLFQCWYSYMITVVSPCVVLVACCITALLIYIKLGKHKVSTPSSSSSSLNMSEFIYLNQGTFDCNSDPNISASRTDNSWAMDSGQHEQTTTRAARMMTWTVATMPPLPTKVPISDPNTLPSSINLDGNVASGPHGKYSSALDTVE
jgi:hypothetical protein